MDAAEKASLLRAFSVYDVILLVITYTDILMQCYVLLVMILATPEKMRQYRSFMMLYTLCDLAFAVMFGVALHPTPVMNLPCSAWRGVFQAFDRNVARLGWAFALFCGSAVLAAQDYCIIYRAAVVWREGRYLQRLVTPTAKLVALVIIFSVSFVNAGIGYFMAAIDKHSPERDPQILVSAYPGSDAYVCVTLERSPIYPVGSIVLPLAAVAEVVFYGLAWSTVLYIRKASLRMSEKSRKLNIQLSLLLLMQTTTPIVSIFVPFLIIIVLTGLQIQAPPSVTMLGYISFSMFPLVNASLTILFITPYRKFTLRLFKRSAPNSTATGSIHWASDVPDRARTKLRVSSISVAPFRGSHNYGQTIM